MVEVRCIWEAEAVLGEGPVWLDRDRALYWVDIKSCRLYRYEPGNDTRSTWQAKEQISSLHPTASGGFVATTRNGFADVTLAGGTIVIDELGGPEATLPGNRFNDGKIDRQGRYWAGSMDDDEVEPTGSLYCMDGDRRWRRVDSGYVITNGPAFSVDGGTLYHTDTVQRRVYAFDLADDGSVGERRVHIEIDGDAGYPDGMTVDAEDCLWVAHFGGWRLTRFSPAGKEIGRIEMPVSNITSCVFGGELFDRLYITTASKGLSVAQLERQPLAGGLFVCTPGVRGLPGHTFGVAA